MKIKIFVISLLRSPDRREAIAARLKTLGLDFAFVDAVDARILPAEFIGETQVTQRIHRDYGRALGVTEIACAMSHAIAYQEIQSSGLDGAIILEDDAIIDGRVGPFFLWLKAQTTPPQGLWLLGGGEYLEKGVIKNYFDFAILSKRPSVSDASWGGAYQIIDCYDRLARACGYFVDAGTALCLHQNNNPPKALADDWPFFIRQGWITPYLCKPCLIEHPLIIAGQSLLQEDRSATAQKAHTKKISSLIKERIGYYQLIYRLKVLFHHWKHRQN